MTNYEKIQKMSVEEMAKHFYYDCTHCAYRGKNCRKHPEMYCEDGAVKWLEMEAEE